MLKPSQFGFHAQSRKPQDTSQAMWELTNAELNAQNCTRVDDFGNEIQYNWNTQWHNKNYFFLQRADDPGYFTF